MSSKRTNETQEAIARLISSLLTASPRVNVNTDDLNIAINYIEELKQKENKLFARVAAWRQDAAARLNVYTTLLKSNLIGSVSQVRVSLIMPTLAAIDADNNASLDVMYNCEHCGADIKFGDRFYRSIDMSFCEKHAPPDVSLDMVDTIDIDKAVSKAIKALGRSVLFSYKD